MKNKLYFAGNPDLPGRPTLALSSSGRMTRSDAIDKSMTEATGLGGAYPEIVLLGSILSSIGIIWWSLELWSFVN
jgi:hypothetical protein